MERDFEKEGELGKIYRIDTVEFEGREYPAGYRVVTEDLESLGLRDNPNILQYSVGEWYSLPPEGIEDGKGDWGGIWLARTLSGAKSLKRYMEEKHGVGTRIFKSAIGEILFCNSGRVKTNAICMVEEIISE
ncbi:MAG TPA: hypothetical protein VJY47_01245 [Candidatus Dojkabacteria bacterium]|nr:hypothetical protein [Candidatus Dojkabacteria bacterium]